jgi:hypothetical protein
MVAVVKQASTVAALVALADRSIVSRATHIVKEQIRLASKKKGTICIVNNLVLNTCYVHDSPPSK